MIHHSSWLWLYIYIGLGRAVASPPSKVRDDVARAILWPLSVVTNLWLIFDRLAERGKKGEVI